MAKIVYFTCSDTQSGGILHFKKIETERIDECIDFLSHLLDNARQVTPKETNFVLKATGGGAYLFKDKLQERLPGVIIQEEDEMDCLITGLNFFVSEIPYEVFTYNEQEPEPMRFEETKRDIYPYMLVNIGSGVSILKVTGPDEFSRISGTSVSAHIVGYMSFLIVCL